MQDRLSPDPDRTRAALCHLSLFTVVGTLIVPLGVGRTTPANDPFTRSHAQGAFAYQLVGLLLFGLTLLGRGLPARLFGLSTFGAEMVAFGFWIVYLCALVLYLGGAAALAVQAYNGQEFELWGYRP